MTKAPRVLLVGGDDRSMLAVARSLAPHEVPFLIAGPDCRGIVGSSRFARGHLVGRPPDARAEPDRFVDFVLEKVRKHRVELVLPTTDRTIEAVARHREVIEREARVAAPPTPAVLNVLDKKLNLETAQLLGVPTPKQFVLERIEQVPELIAELGFPIVLKNPGPAAQGERPSFDFRWLVAHDESELRRHLERCPPASFPIIQQLVTGITRNVCCFAVGGEIVAIHEYTSVRRRDGYSVFREVTPLGADLRRYAEVLLGALRWDGVAHVGFIVRAGDARYMETNGRFWGSTAGSVAAGWNFPLWMYDYFANSLRPPQLPPDHGVGRRSRWLFGDLQLLVEDWRGDVEPGRSMRGRRRAAVEFLSGFRSGVDVDVFRLDDPLPELVEHWRGARLAISRRRHPSVSTG